MNPRKVLTFGSRVLDVVGFYYLVFSFFSFQKTIFKKVYYSKEFNETNLFYYYLTTLTIGILSLNSGITFAQNETSEIDDSPLITTTEIDEGLENNTVSQMANNTSIIE